jgi:SAM-dependent methyltransferase
MEHNTYSRAWFEFFLEIRPSTEAELAFLTTCLPNPPYTRLLDLACGQGRHANPLARLGYRVLGIDRDATALEFARRQAPQGVSYLQADMRNLSGVSGLFDAAICMWQSFGYFSPAQNKRLLAQVSRLLRPGGRLILDIYHPAFWETHLGSFQVERRGVMIHTTNQIQEGRMFVELSYSDGRAQDSFDWQLFTPEEITHLASEQGMTCLHTCAGYQWTQPASVEMPLVQYVFERTY